MDDCRDDLTDPPLCGEIVELLLLPRACRSGGGDRIRCKSTSSLGNVGLDGDGDPTCDRTGYEKLTDVRLLGLPSLSCGAGAGAGAGVDIIASEVRTFEGSPAFAALNHVPDASLFIFCDAVRTGVLPIPKLFGLCICRPFAFRPASIFSGIAGTGGAISSGEFLGIPPILDDRCGEGDRNERWLIELELPFLSSPGLLPPPSSGAVPDDEMEACLRRVRLVCTSPTFVGVIGRALSAAEAAAAEREVLDPVRLNAERAAVAAFGLAVAEMRGWFEWKLARAEVSENIMTLL